MTPRQAFRAYTSKQINQRNEAFEAGYRVAYDGCFRGQVTLNGECVGLIQPKADFSGPKFVKPNWLR